ncbi:MAG: amidohydrolase, partial [Gemmatimonadota bacterium]
ALAAIAWAGGVACREPQPVTLALLDGRVWTGDPHQPWAEAIAVSGDRITAVGSSEEVRGLLGDDAQIVELQGRLVVPAFGDSHTHFVGGGFGLLGLDLRYADSKEEFVRRIAAYAAKLPPGRWITGGEWDHERWPGAPLPRREWIDSVTPNHPVFITRLDGHMGLANSLALREAGVTRETAEPEGGVIVRDPRSGEPTGVLKDAAMPLVTSKIPPPGPDEQDAALQAALDHAASLGVTSIHDMSVPWRDIETYRRFRDRGALTVRVQVFPDLAGWRRVADEVAREGRGDAWFRFGGLKAYVDGSLGSMTALFVEPFTQDPSTHGELVTPLDSLRQWIFDADDAGLHLAIHAIGDSANHLLLDLYQDLIETRGARDRRLRIEHAQHLRPQDVPRFGQLGVIPSMQPYHAIDDGRWAEKRIGP